MEYMNKMIDPKRKNKQKPKLEPKPKKDVWQELEDKLTALLETDPELQKSKAEPLKAVFQVGDKT
jgi:hypothetical protein